MHEGTEVYHHIFLKVVLDDGKWSLSAPGRLTPEENTPPFIAQKTGRAPDRSFYNS
jgi:hypothetical protein